MFSYPADYLAKVSLYFCIVYRSDGFHIYFQVLGVFPAVVFRATLIRLFPIVHLQDILDSKLFDNFSQPVQVCIVHLPLVIVLDMYYFSLDITTMNGSLGYIQAIQAVDKDTRHAFGKADFAHLFQFWQTQFQRFDEILHIHRILAGLVQEELEIECLVVAVVDVACIIDSIIIDLAIFREFYHGLVLFHQHLFEFLVLLDQFKDKIRLHII